MSADSTTAPQRAWLSDRQVDLVTGDVVRAGESIGRLTTKERELLTYLVGRTGEEVPRVDLLTDVWGYAPTAKTRAVDFTVRRLRQKIEPSSDEPVHIVTVHGVGYRFESGPMPGPAVEAVAEGLAWGPVEPPEIPVPQPAVQWVNRSLAQGIRLVTLVTQAPALGAAVVQRVASEWDGGGAVIPGGLEGLCVAAGVPTGDVSALCHALRRRTPPLVVLPELDPTDVAHVDGLARLLRAVPELRLVVTARRRLALSAEHALSVQGDAHRAATDLAELDATWAALDEPLRQAWAALSVCAESVDLEGAEALVGPDAVDRLDGLQDAGLLGYQPLDEGLRFALPDEVRRYGRQRLGGGMAARLQDRRRWVLERYDAVVTSLGRQVPPALQAETAELQAIWADGSASPRARTRAAVLLAAVGASAARDLARLDGVEVASVPDVLDLAMLLLRAQLRLDVGRAGDARDDARLALRAAHALSHPVGRAASGVVLAEALARLGRLSEAREAAQQARAAQNDVSDRAVGVSALYVLGRVLAELGEREGAEDALRDAVHQARLAGDRTALARSQTALGTLLRHRGQIAAAQESYDLAEQALVSVGGVAAVAAAGRLALERAILELERGEARSALDSLTPLASTLEAHGRTRDAAEAWLGVASSRWQGGDLDGAVEGFDRARLLFEGVEDRLYGGLALAWSGATAAALGEVDTARGWLDEARDRLDPLGLRRGREVLRACGLHLDHALGRPVDEAATWYAELDGAPEAWGDVRQALRLLLFSKEAP